MKDFEETCASEIYLYVYVYSQIFVYAYTQERLCPELQVWPTIPPNSPSMLEISFDNSKVRDGVVQMAMMVLDMTDRVGSMIHFAGS